MTSGLVAPRVQLILTQTISFDDPRTMDFELLRENLQCLRKGVTANIPQYSFKQSRRVGYTELCPADKSVIIVEGTHAMNSKISDLMDVMVCITGDPVFFVLCCQCFILSVRWRAF